MLKLLSKIIGNLTIKNILIITALVIITLFFFDLAFMILLVILTILTSYFVKKMRRYVVFFKKLGIELVTLTTIITSYLYGPVFGIGIGLILLFFHLAIARYFGVFVLWTIQKHIILGYVPAFFIDKGITEIGISLVFELGIVYLIIASIAFRKSIITHFTWTITNMVFNVLLFIHVAPILTSFLI